VANIESIVPDLNALADVSCGTFSKVSSSRCFCTQKTWLQEIAA
ncbi:hypothetical protein NPIL_5771, partial [Nephila pilipes]